MKRYDIINHLILTQGYKSYLEVGTQGGECFSRILVEEKLCVDPIKNYVGLTHQMTSDRFFEQNKKTFDIIFVDGLHLEDQCTKDIQNSLKVLNKDGVIVVHDCLPHCEEYTQVCWNGTVYKSIIDLRCTNPTVTVSVVDTDCGCGIITKQSTSLYTKASVEDAKKYSYYEQNKAELMNVISVDRFLDIWS